MAKATRQANVVVTLTMTEPEAKMLMHALAVRVSSSSVNTLPIYQALLELFGHQG